MQGKNAMMRTAIICLGGIVLASTIVRAGELPAGSRAAIADLPLTALIGMSKAAFVKAHPKAVCVNQGPGIELCKVIGSGPLDCPLRLPCDAPIYGFRRLRLTSYQASLRAQTDWNWVYRFAMTHYRLARSVTTTSGTSAFFNTRRGVLVLGHALAIASASPVWALRFYLPRPEPAFD